MKDELITLETAKLAKEKGFNEPSQNHFRSSGEEFKENFSPFTKNTEWQSDSISRPTQSLLQRWLREVHNIIVYVAPLIPDCKEWGYCVYHIDTNYEKNTLFSNTYEEALELALQEALKLIK